VSAPPPVPFGDLARVYVRHRRPIDSRLGQVLRRGRFIMGAELEEFERAFAAYLGVGHVVGVGSGTDAIALTLRALDIGPGDDVVTPALSAAFTALGVVQAGAQPVFADVDSATGNLDAPQLEAALTARTRAVLPVHLYGRPAPVDRLLALAAPRGIAVIEDAAQAHGARLGGRMAGSLARAAAFSFYPSKNLGAFGDAGAVATGDASLAERVRRLRDGGQRSRYEHVEAGVNSRLDEVQAAILSVRLASLDEDNRRRAAIARRYDQALPGGVVHGGADGPDVQSAHHLYAVRTPRRDALADHLAAHGVATAVHYPMPLHRQPAFGRPAVSLPSAEAAAAEVLSLPMFPELSDDEVERVAAAVAAYAPAAGTVP
jgi:dTDP-3-amino-3,4,6-trideoxy-alpha-D-glucose transaminase